MLEALPPTQKSRLFWTTTKHQPPTQPQLDLNKGMGTFTVKSSSGPPEKGQHPAKQDQRPAKPTTGVSPSAAIRRSPDPGHPIPALDLFLRVITATVGKRAWENAVKLALLESLAS